MNITETIATQIRYHEAELERLRIALDVINGLPLPQEKKQPMLTIRKPIAIGSSSRSKPRKELRDKIRAALSGGKVAKSEDIMRAIYSNSPTLKERKSVWNAISDMYRKEELSRVQMGHYTLREKAHEDA
jgi:hypothetical protein